MRVPATAPAQTGLQVMFIVDTTGSMTDEIAYLQKDFSAIAERVGNDGVTWSVNFYRDEGDDYVTRVNGFTSDVAEVQARINAEYADGGGDTPEAVAEILSGRLDDAEAALTCQCAQSEYLRAIIAARKGDAAGVRTHLDAVREKNQRLYDQSRRDIEFAKYR